MFKKILSIIILVFLASCNTAKPYVQTSKVSVKKTTPIVKTEKKPVIKAPDNHVIKEKDEVVIQNKSGETQILEATTKVKVTTEIVVAYIDKYKDIAKTDMTKYGIPASITLSQAILESGSGTGPLSVQANNHFGIKCHKDWNGESIKHTDDAPNECFRKYEKPEKSFEDHSVFLLNRPWYAKLFKLAKDDYKGWAKGLKAAGYATDPKYPDKLIALIERYQLYQYDDEVLGKPIKEFFNPKITNEPKIEPTLTLENSYVVISKDTLYSISKKFNLSIETLKKMNNLNENAISVGQTIKIK